MNYENLTRSIKVLSSCQDIEELNNKFGEVIGKLGYQKFAYMRFAKNHLSIEQSIYTYDEKWKIRYFKCKYDQIDPIFTKAFDTKAPFFWSSCMPEFSENYKTFFEEATSFGIFNGITVPMKANANALAILTMAGARTEENKYLISVPDRDIVCARLISECFHQMAIQLSDMAHLRLKENHKKVLTMVSYGATSKDIACILEKSEPYVCELIVEASNKLGSKSRIMSVLNAKKMNVLDL